MPEVSQPRAGGGGILSAQEALPVHLRARSEQRALAPWGPALRLGRTGRVGRGGEGKPKVHPAKSQRGQEKGRQGLAEGQQTVPSEPGGQRGHRQFSR